MENPELPPPPPQLVQPDPVNGRGEYAQEDNHQQYDDDSALSISLVAAGSCLMVVLAFLILLTTLSGALFMRGRPVADSGTDSTKTTNAGDSNDDNTSTADAYEEKQPAQDNTSAQMTSAAGTRARSAKTDSAMNVADAVDSTTATASGLSGFGAQQPTAKHLSPRHIISGGAFFGLQATGKSVVYIVDCSGSMVGEPFQRARFELLRSVRTLKDAKFFVILFSDTHYPMYYQDVENQLAEPTPEELQRLSAWLDMFPVNGGTNPASALTFALNLTPETIFLLSDGEIDSKILSLLRQQNSQQTQIHTVGFLDRSGEALLKQIAADHRGEYRFIAK
jgi:hypothetical protein